MGHFVLALALGLASAALLVGMRSKRRLAGLGAVALLLLSIACVWIAARSESFNADESETYSDPVELCVVSAFNWFLAAGGNGDADGIYADAKPETRVLIDLAEKHFPLAEEQAARTSRYPDSVIEGYEAARARLLLWGCVAHYGSEADKVLRVQQGLCATYATFTFEC